MISAIMKEVREDFLEVVSSPLRPENELEFAEMDWHLKEWEKQSGVG